MAKYKNTSRPQMRDAWHEPRLQGPCTALPATGELTHVFPPPQTPAWGHGPDGESALMRQGPSGLPHAHAHTHTHLLEPTGPARPLRSTREKATFRHTRRGRR